MKIPLKPVFCKTNFQYIRWWENILLFFVFPKYYGWDDGSWCVFKKMFGKIYIIDSGCTINQELKDLKIAKREKKKSNPNSLTVKDG